MVRKGAEARLADIGAAGAACFGRLGYRRTRMAEVASQAGLSAGAIYTYVESKEALLHLVLAVAFDLDTGEGAGLPLTTPSLDQTLDLIRRGLRLHGSAPILNAALAVDHPGDVGAELADIVSEQYLVVSKLRVALSVIEACATDIPELDELYFGRRRRRQIDALVRYVEARSATGDLNAEPDAAVAAQIVTEIIAWFAWKRLEGHDAERFDDERARQTVIHFICNALVPR